MCGSESFRLTIILSLSSEFSPSQVATSKFPYNIPLEATCGDKRKYFFKKDPNDKRTMKKYNKRTILVKLEDILLFKMSIITVTPNAEAICIAGIMIAT